VDQPLMLPPGMSSMFIIEPLILNKKTDGCFIYYGEFIRLAILVYFGFGIQALFIYQIVSWDMLCVQDEEVISQILQIFCAFVFEIAVFSQIRKSFDMAFLLSLAPSASGQQHWDLASHLTSEGARGAVVTEGEINWLHAQVRRARGKPKEDTAEWSLKKMTIKYKMWAISGIAMPKLLLNVALSVVAGIWIPKSTTTEKLVLNTLAVNFIVEVDHLLYSAFVSDGQKQDLEHHTPIMRKVKVGRGWDRVCRWLVTAYLVPVVVVSGSVLIVNLEYQISSRCDQERSLFSIFSPFAHAD
jgi:hypothetical protein